eukprot:751839-Hanusia_phi.AAC.2
MDQTWGRGWFLDTTGGSWGTCIEEVLIQRGGYLKLGVGCPTPTLRGKMLRCVWVRDEECEQEQGAGGSIEQEDH